MSFGFVFPGQGSQSVGMLAGFAAETSVRTTFDQASATLGYDLWKQVTEGPEAELNQTQFTQPAMLAAGIATACVSALVGRPTMLGVARTSAQRRASSP